MTKLLVKEVRVNSDFAGLDHHFDQINNQDRASYINGSNAHACAAGIAHGGVDFVSGQCCSLAMGCYCVGRVDFDDDWETQMNITNAYMQSQAETMDSFNSRVSNFLGVDPNNTIYQTSCNYTRVGLEAGAIVAGGVGIVRGGISAARSSGKSEQNLQEKLAKLPGKNYNMQ